MSGRGFASDLTGTLGELTYGAPTDPRAGGSGRLSLPRTRLCGPRVSVLRVETTPAVYWQIKHGWSCKFGQLCWPGVFRRTAVTCLSGRGSSWLTLPVSSLVCRGRRLQAWNCTTSSLLVLSATTASGAQRRYIISSPLIRSSCSCYLTSSGLP